MRKILMTALLAATMAAPALAADMTTTAPSPVNPNPVVAAKPAITKAQAEKKHVKTHQGKHAAQKANAAKKTM